MPQKIQFNRGNLANLPTLDQGEPGWTVDEEKLYIGGSSGNVLINKDSVVENGFPDADDVDLSFVDGTRTFSATPAVSSFVFYSGGQKFTKTSAQTVVIANTSGLHFIYFNTSGVLTSTTVWDTDTLILEGALVAIVLWDATSGTHLRLQRETHGRMNGETHAYLHEVMRAVWVAGLELTDVIAGDTGNLDTHAQIGVENGIFRDEDIRHVITDGSPQTLSAPAQLPGFYRDGASGTWKRTAATNFPCTKGTSTLYYNEWTGATWQRTEVTSQDFVLSHIFATGDIDEPIIWIMGQNEYSLRSEAEAGALVELKELLFGDLEIIIPELLPIGTLIFQTATNKTNSVAASIEPTDDGSDYVDWRFASTAAGGGIGGATVWGEIGGTLSDQTDLQNALDAKVDAVTSTDNAIPKFDGTTGQVQNTGVTIDDDNVLLTVGSSQAVKLGVYNNTNYGIGMQSSRTYGGLTTWAMTFQMHTTTTMGFVWKDTGHGAGEGAMALTCEGQLTVADSMRLGFGETDTTTPGATYVLEVNGDVEADAFYEGGTAISAIYAPISHTHTASQITDFDTEVANNSAVAANTAKVSNIPTSLSEGTRTGTTYGITSDGGADDIILQGANVTEAGLMSATSFGKLQGIESGAEVNVDPDMTITPANDYVIFQAAGGEQDTLDAATALVAGCMTASDKGKLDGIASGANNYTHPTHSGDDFSIDTGALTGAFVISDLDINVTTDTLGHVTDANAAVSTRQITAANIGAATAAHTHELDELDATGITDGYVLTADGAGNAVWEIAASGGGISDIVDDTSPQLGGDLDCNGFDVHLGDADYVRLGDSQDMLLYFSGTSGYLNNTAGVMYLEGSGVVLKKAAGDTFVSCIEGANVELYYDGVGKLTTASWGATVIGQLKVTDDAYDSGWNGSVEVPTKNAVYDKIESLGLILTRLDPNTGPYDNSDTISWSGSYNLSNFEYIYVEARVNYDNNTTGIVTALARASEAITQGGVKVSFSGQAGNSDNRYHIVALGSLTSTGCTVFIAQGGTSGWDTDAEVIGIWGVTS